MKESKKKFKTFLLGAIICSATMSAYAQSQTSTSPNLKGKETQTSNPLKELVNASLDQHGKPTLTPGKQKLPDATNTATNATVAPHARQQVPNAAAIKKMIEESPQLQAKFIQQLKMQNKQGTQRGVVTAAEYENAVKQLITNQTK